MNKAYKNLKEHLDSQNMHIDENGKLCYEDVSMDPLKYQPFLRIMTANDVTLEGTMLVSLSTGKRRKFK